MQAYGSDRLRRDGERWILSTRLEKGWIARVEKTLTSAEFPGTAVMCEDQYYEVVAVESIPNGVRYILEPWAEHHAMRTTDRYDAESENARMEARRAAHTHNQRRRAINLLGILAGHLPGDVQEQIGRDYGILAQWLTYMSTIPEFIVGAALAQIAARRMLESGIPATVIIAALIILADAIPRTLWTFMTGRPIGSVPGLIAYTVYAAATGKLVVSDLPKIPDAPEPIARQDALAMREPLVTLLPPDDQRRVARRFDYRYERLAPKVAAVILAFAMLGAISAARQHHVPGALVAAAVALEQIYRLSSFHRGPAGSVFGYLVRPLVRKLL